MILTCHVTTPANIITLCTLIIPHPVQIVKGEFACNPLLYVDALKDYAGEFAFRQVELLDSRRNFV